jgi:adenylate cyclase, class 2
MKNLELKAAAPDLARLRLALRSIGASRQRRLVQADTYFLVPDGRLKLRQRNGLRRAELIFYRRPDVRRARTSEYHKLAVQDAPGLLGLLRVMFEEGVCVRKRRDLWMVGRTRVHLDEVEELGTFVEIEVPFTRSSARARQTMTKLVKALGIQATDVFDRSYADLLAQRAASQVHR